MLLDVDFIFIFFTIEGGFKPTQTSTSVPFCLTTTVLALFTALTWNNISPNGDFTAIYWAFFAQSVLYTVAQQ